MAGALYANECVVPQQPVQNPSGSLRNGPFHNCLSNYGHSNTRFNGHTQCLFIVPFIDALGDYHGTELCAVISAQIRENGGNGGEIRGERS